MLRTIRSVAVAEVIVGPTIARRVLGYFAAGRGSGHEPSLSELTDREHHILVLLEQHLTNPEIVTRLDLSPKTVRNHITDILTKLQVAARS